MGVFSQFFYSSASFEAELMETGGVSPASPLRHRDSSASFEAELMETLLLHTNQTSQQKL